jgi:hypothetical protein
MYNCNIISKILRANHAKKAFKFYQQFCHHKHFRQKGSSTSNESKNQLKLDISNTQYFHP